MSPELAGELFEASRRLGHDTASRARVNECVGRLEPDVRRIVVGTLACKKTSLLRANVDLDDAVQDVLTKMVAGKLPSGEDARQPERVLASWVRRVAVNWFVSAMRQAKIRGRRPDGGDADGAEPPEEAVPAPRMPDPVEATQLARALAPCADRLVGKRRLLWDALVRNPDLPVPQLAVRLGYVERPHEMTIKIRDAVHQVRKEMRLQIASCLEQAAVWTRPASRRRK